MTRGNLFPVNKEQELLLSIISLDPSQNERVPDLLSHVDWPKLNKLVNRHGVFPLFYQRLKFFSGGRIPPEQAEILEKSRQVYLQNNIRIIWKLIQCIDLLNENEIDYIVLKGPVFSFQVYGDMGLRYFSDVDILIREKDFSRTFDLLSRSGYAPERFLQQTQRKFQMKTDNHFSFNRQGDIFEIHWGIAPQGYIYPLNPELMWQDIQVVCLLEKNINCLSSTNTILFACLHGAKHSWKQLKWIADLAYLVQRYPEETFIGLFEKASHFGFQRQICLGLQLSEKLIGADLPAKVHGLIDKQKSVQRIADDIIMSFSDGSNKPSKFGDYKFYLFTRERWHDRLYFFFNLIFVPKPPDWHLISLPEQLYFLYYIIRPIRLLVMTIKFMFQSLFGTR